MKAKEKLEINKNKIKELYLNGVSGVKLEKEYEIPRTLIYKMLKEYGIKSRKQSETSRIYQYRDKNCFKKIDEEWKAYFLGFMYADGYVSRSHRQCFLRIHQKDEEILKIFLDKIYQTAPTIKKYKGLLEIHISSHDLVADLADLGLVNKKTFKIKIPFDKIQKDMIPHFIRGYFDGDGYVSDTKHREVSICSNNVFVEQLQEYLQKIGIIGSSIKHLNKKNSYFKIHRYDNIIRMYHFLYENATIFLSRKKNRFDNVYEYYLKLSNSFHSPIWGISYSSEKNRWYSSRFSKFSGYKKTEKEIYEYLKNISPEEYPLNYENALKYLKRS